MSAIDLCACNHYRGNHRPGCIVVGCGCTAFADVPVHLSDPAANTPGPRHTGAVDTEAAAGDLIAPRSGTLRMKALAALAARHPDGLTDTELAAVVGAYRYSAAPRRVELVQGGWVEDSGQRRRTGHDRDEVVWRVTAAGIARWAGVRSPA